MPRANLGQLLGRVDDPAPAIAAAEAEPSAQAVTAEAAAAPVPKLDRQAPIASAPVASVAGPTYLRFVRKDTRLREDQLEALTSHARRLNRKRRSTGVRVTENTLIRVAVDLLLDRIEKAAGDDEAALLKSVRP